MTGADIRTELLTKLGEFGLGYFDNTRLNSFIFNAVTDIIDRKVEEYQKTQKVTREMQPVIIVLNNVTPTNGSLDVSATSTQVPNYYQIINLNVYSDFMGSTISKYAMERRLDQKIDDYSEGTARYPRYLISEGIISIEPSNAKRVDIDYFIKPIEIDVNDNSTEVPYNNKLIQLIIDKTIGIIGFEERDDFSILSSENMQKNNP